MNTTVKKEIISWAKTIILAVLLAVSVNSFLIVNAKVPTGSMENTIMTGDRILALRGSYWFSSPERGDIIIFPYPDDPTGETLYVKRIIGVGGDRIDVYDGQVYVNEQPIEEEYIKEPTQGNFGPYFVPEGECFAMGDNRNSSIDARFWKNTYIPEDEILGKVVLKYYKGFRWLA